MNARKTSSLIALVLLVALMLPAFPVVSADPPATGPDSQFVRVPAPAMADVDRLGLNPQVALDYGTFFWLGLSNADFSVLSASDVPFTHVPDAGQIRFMDLAFDPIVDGEPSLPKDMVAGGDGPGFRLIQLVGPASDAWLAQLEAAGIPLLQYYPHNAFLAWTTPAQAESVEGFDFVRWQGAFHPAYKINSDLQDYSGRIDNVDIMFYNDGDVEGTLDAIAGLGAEILNTYPAQPDQAFFDAIVQLDADAIEGIARLNTVLWLGYSSPEPILDDEMSSQIVAGNYTGGIPFTGYYTWLGNLGYNGTGVRWAIVDTGVDYDHPDLGPHIAGGYSFPGACDPPGQPGSDCAGGGHGTHVAGIVGGDATGGFTDPSGFLYGLGIAPAYEIFAMNSLSGPYWPPTGGWQEHSKRAVLGGAIGGNNSWTTGEGTHHGYQASERTHDIMVRDGNFDTTTVAEPFIEVFSAGNSGSGGLTAPKEAKNLTVVASSRNYRVGSIDDISTWSSRGPAEDGRWVPTVAAPGEQIASARNDLGGSCSTPIPGTNDLYAYCSGTSMAAPHVSGSITLITEWWRTFNGGADPSPAMAKALLVNGAVDMDEGHFIPNIHEGWGRIHLTNVMDNGASMFYDDQSTVFDNTGESWQISVGIPDPSKPFKVSLAWSDAPGAVGANPALVNDLDLVVDHSGDTYYGNQFSGGWSTPGGSADTINNLENVYVQVPGDSATITVQASNIVGDGVPYSGDTTDQDFAIVCYNCALQADFALTVDPDTQDVCIPDDAIYNIVVDSILGFNEPVTFHTEGEPVGTAVQFTPNPVTPPGATVLTISDTGSATPGSYTVDIVGVAPTSTHTETVGLNLYIAPTVDLTSDSPTELGYGMHFTATTTGTPEPTYTWDFGGPGYGVGLDGPTPVFTYTQHGTYTVVVSAENGCGSDSDAQQVEVLCYEPDVTASNDSPVELGGPVHFAAQLLSGTLPVSYTWDFHGPGYGTGLDTATPVFTYTEAGDYTAVVAVENDCGQDSAATDVVVTPVCTEVVDVDLTLVSTGTINPGDLVIFSADIAPDDAAKPYSYTVDYGDGTAPITSSSSDDPLALDHAYTITGTFTVEISIWNCDMTQPVTDTATVVVEEEPPVLFHYIYLPVVVRSGD